MLGVGPGWAFALDAATFVVSAAFLVRLRPRPRGEPGERTTVLAELGEGWSEVRSRTWIWVIVAAFSLAVLTAWGPWMTLGPTISIERYDTARGLRHPRLGDGRGHDRGRADRLPRGGRGTPFAPPCCWRCRCPIALGCFGFGLPVAFLLPVFVLAGMGIALFDVWWNTALAERVPPHMLSRVTAYDWMGSLALLPLGYVLAGPLGEAFGAVEVLSVGSAIGARRAGGLADLARGLEPACYGRRSVPVTSTTTSPPTRTRPSSSCASSRLGRPISTPCVTSRRSSPVRAFR